MKKTVKALFCMGIVLTALCAICSHFDGFKAAADGVHYEQQLNGLKDWFFVFVVIAFFTGFIPVFAHESMKAMQPQPAAEITTKCQAPGTDEMPANISTDPAPLYVGKIYTSIGCNCSVRVKSLKTPAPTPRPTAAPKVEMPDTFLIHYILN